MTGFRMTLIWVWLAALATACLTGATSGSANEVWPTRVTATYKITLAGLEFGTFNFSSSLNGRNYSLVGEAKLTWGLGLFKWQGATRASGMLGDQATPASYSYEFKGHDRAGSVKLGFKERNVTSLAVQPVREPETSPEYVPLKPQHMKDVLDPMTAILSISHGSVATPCGRRVSIFDGKTRFDLVFSFRRQVSIPELRPSGEPSIGYVCRVQYIPIAGHKDNSATRDFAANQGIEVTLRPVPSANVLIPYRVVIPTSVGSAILQSKTAEIISPGDRRIAFAH